MPCATQNNQQHFLGEPMSSEMQIIPPAAITNNRVNLADPDSVKRVIDAAASASIDFLKFDSAVFTRFSLVPGVEALWSMTHYDQQLGSFLCLQDPAAPICCNGWGMARVNMIAPAWGYLNASRVDGTLPDSEPIIVAPRILRLSAQTAQAMIEAAKEKGVTAYSVDYRATKTADGKRVIVKVVSLSPRWKKVEEEALRLAKNITALALEKAVGKKLTVAEITAGAANAGAGLPAEQPLVEVLD
jgi:hypothetical protein